MRILKSASIIILVFSLNLFAHAEVIDESWRQVYEFQSKMAARGNNSAQFKLGEMYQHGRGVEKDYDTAINWYKKAKSNGHSEAAERIAMIYQAIRNEKAAKRKAEEEERKAEAKRKAEEELARQKAKEQKRAAAEAKRKREAKRAAKRTAKLEESTEPEQEAQVEEIKHAKLSDEERARKIKEAQERAKIIAEQNRLKQQQRADAALQQYRQSVAAKTKTKDEKQKSELPQKYIDPFE
jgi:hypothetical protein